MKDIVGYEGLYAITTCGKVWSYRSKKFLKPYLNHSGYHRVNLIAADGTNSQPFVHKLVLEAYVPNPDNLPQGNHKDENKDHNYLGNLEWISRKDNLNYGTRNQRIGKALSKPVYCEELQREFESITAAAKELNINTCGISKCCNGKAKTAGKYHWRFVDTIVE